MQAPAHSNTSMHMVNVFCMNLYIYSSLCIFIVIFMVYLFCDLGVNSSRALTSSIFVIVKLWPRMVYGIYMRERSDKPQGVRGVAEWIIRSLRRVNAIHHKRP